MSQNFEIFFSNRLEVLYQNLKTSLFGTSTHPFKRRLIIVYGPAMKNWLMLQMANDPDLGIAAGIEIIYINQAFETLINLFLEEPSSILPSQLELALAIEKELMGALRSFNQLTTTEQNDWLSLVDYLKLDASHLSSSLKLSRKMERRLINLSQQMARFFLDYGRFAGPLMAKWEKTTPFGWQHRLWNQLFQAGKKWSYLYKEFQKPLVPVNDCEIYFFSISFIARSEFEFLRRLIKWVPVHYYLLSPCAVFWSDIKSDKETAYLHAYWQKKLGANSPKVAKLDELLRDRNALLANFGRLGRSMAYQIETNSTSTDAYYVLPQNVEYLDEDIFVNEDVQLIETHQPLSLLGAIQADVLLMRNPQETESINISHEDLSFQVHVASTMQREIQILYNNLMRLIEKRQDHLCPSDMIVMAPQILDYAPYIQSVFGSQESQLDFQILDLGMQSHNEIVQGFLQLLQLSESRWNATQLLQLFEHPSFQRRHQLTNADYQVIQQWVEKAGIRWGDDGSHRNELLERTHCEQGMTDSTSIGTWDYGLSRLLLGLTMIQQTKTSSSTDEVPPIDSIDFAQAELLGQWIRLLHALRDDLTPLCDKTQMTLEDWTRYLGCLLENYFQPDFNDPQSIEDYEDLKAQFDILRFSARSFKETEFPYQSVKIHLDTLLQQRGLTYRENYLQTVRFCSMMPLRSIPAKVIALIGMQEGAFPRTSPHSALNLMASHEDADYCPSSTDYDRYLFLEAIQSAQENILISYQGHHQQDGKELQPSLVIEELLSYLNRHYTIQGKKISSYCLFRHPFDSFHASYFQPTSPFFSYSKSDYQSAQAYYSRNKNPPHCFVEQFGWIESASECASESEAEIQIIDLKQLAALARNPIKFHLNHVLNIYLQTQEDRQFKVEEDLIVSSLDKHILKQASIKEPVDHVLTWADKEGKLPFGLFKTVASQSIKEEVSALHQRLQKYDIRPQEIFQIEFCPTCTSPQQIEADHWLFPAVKIQTDQGKIFQVVGKLKHVTPKGLVVMGKSTLGEVWKTWPQFLLYHYAADMHPDCQEKQLILTHASQPKKAFFDDSKVYLKQFLEYHSLCLNSFSPLLPDWIPHILDGNVKGLQDKMRLLFNDSFGEFQSQDLRWILNKDRLPNSEKMIQEWKGEAERLLGDLVRHWYGSKNVSSGES